MRQSLLAVLNALLFVALTTFSVQANFKDESKTNEASVNTVVEESFFKEGFESTAIAGFYASPESIAVGESTTINWNTINAATCTPTGDIDEWNNSTLGVPSGQVQLTPSTVNTYSLTLTCTDGIEVQDVRTISVAVTEPVVVLTSVENFVATPDSIVEGESTTLTWITENAVSCTPSGDLEEWNNSVIDVPSGELPIAISTAGSYSLTLTCESETGHQGSATIPVTVTEPVVGDCTRELNEGAEVRWNQIFRSDWPGPRSQYVVVSIPRYSYISLEFHTGQIEDTGSIINFEATATEGSRLFAISKCPGDFNVAPECSNVSDAYQQDILWATTGAPGYCQLEKDTTYYWNTTFTDGVDPNSTECLGTYCYTTLKASNNDYVE